MSSDLKKRVSDRVIVPVFISCFLLSPVMAWGQTQPRFYAYFQAEFSDLPAAVMNPKDQRKYARVEELIKKFQTGNSAQDVILPTDDIPKTVLPKPDEILWAFKNTEMLGTTRVKNYSIVFSGAGSRKLCFTVKDPIFNQCLFVTVDPGTRTKYCPKICHAEKLSPEMEKKWLKRIDKAWQSQAVPPPVPAVTATTTPSATPTATFSPTLTPTPTFHEKVNHWVRGLLGSPRATSTPTPQVTATAWIPTPSPIATAMPTPAPEPFSWSRDAKVMGSFNYTSEKVKVFQAKATLPYDSLGRVQPTVMIKTVFLIDGIPFDLKSIAPAFYEFGTPIYDYAIQAMGKTYFVFSAANSGSLAVIVCRREKTGLKTVYIGFTQSRTSFQEPKMTGD
jgi:hypothetical protein